MFTSCLFTYVTNYLVFIFMYAFYYLFLYIYSFSFSIRAEILTLPELPEFSCHRGLQTSQVLLLMDKILHYP